MTQITTIFGVVVTPTVLLSALVVCADIVAYVYYNLKLFSGKGSPSKVLWFIWVIIAGLNAASYLSVSQDTVKTALAIENAFACVITFCFAYKYGEVKRLTSNEKKILSIGIAAGAAWWVFRNAFYANALLQIATIVSFWPFIAKVWAKPESEPRIPWLIWTVSYAMNLVVVILRWRGSWHDLFYPINYAVQHLAVFVLTLRRTRSGFVPRDQRRT